MEQVQAISPRAMKLVYDAPVRDHSFKDAKGFWLHVVMLGLILLGGASALAVGGVKHDIDDAELMKFKMGFVAGPAGPKLWVLNDLLHSRPTMVWAISSLIVYAAGVIAVMWPERVGIMGLAGIGRLIACLMGVAALIYGIDLLHGESDVGRILKMGYGELLTWLIFLEMAAMILVNMRIAGLAGRGGYHGLSKVSGAMIAIQASGILMLLFALNVTHNGTGLMWASAGAFAAGGVGVSVIGLFLVLRIAFEVIARRVSSANSVSSHA